MVSIKKNNTVYDVLYQFYMYQSFCRTFEIVIAFEDSIRKGVMNTCIIK